MRKGRERRRRDSTCWVISVKKGGRKGREEGGGGRGGVLLESEREHLLLVRQRLRKGARDHLLEASEDLLVHLADLVERRLVHNVRSCHCYGDVSC